MGKKGPLWWRESDWLLRGSSAANQILLRHSGPILSFVCCTADTHTSQFLIKGCDFRSKRDNVLQIFKFHSNTIISALFTHCSPIDQICIVAEECRFVPRWCETNALGVRLIQFTN